MTVPFDAFFAADPQPRQPPCTHWQTRRGDP